MKRAAALLLLTAMLLGLCACGKPAQTPAEDTPPAEEAAQAPRNEVSVIPGEGGTFVRTAEGTGAAMLDVDHWIREGDDAVLMDEAAIRRFNGENAVPICASDGNAAPPLGEMGETLDGSIVVSLLSCETLPEDPSALYLGGVPTTAEYWNGLMEQVDIPGVGDQVSVRFGYSVTRTTLRKFPSADRIYESPDDRYYDYMLSSECMPFLPLAVLHESLDGAWYYVLFDSFGAWLHKDAVALCSGREEWLGRQGAEDILTVTGRELRLGDDPWCEALSGLVLPMGTHLPLVRAEEAPEIIHQRRTYGNYVVLLPTRGEDGWIRDEYALIPVTEDVTVGVLPYTAGNVLRQAFKLQGDRYGWGGDLRANDCSGIVREIYRCFGFVLPRVGQTEVKGAVRVDMGEMSGEEKLEVLRELTLGSLLSFPGHIMLYLGMEGDVPYVISAVGSFVQPESAGETMVRPNSVCVNSLYVRRGSLITWLEALRTAVTIV